MQARFLSASLFALALTGAGSAAAEPNLDDLLAWGACPELPICGNCKADVADGAADAEDAPGTETAASDALQYNFGGIEGAANQAPSSPPPPPPPEHISLNFERYTASGESGASGAAPGSVQTPPSEGQHDYFLRLPGVEGESDPPPPPPPPPPAPPAPMHSEQGVSAGDPDPQAIGLIVPAVQRVREAARPLPPPPPPQNAETQQQISAAAEEDPPRERPRRNFSLTIGGVTVGTGGVNVAVGDVTGDGGDNRSRGRRSSGGGSRGSTAGAPRR